MFGQTLSDPRAPALSGVTGESEFPYAVESQWLELPAREVLGNHRGQSQQSRLELGLRFSH
jgi:hypothetical protein